MDFVAVRQTSPRRIAEFFNPEMMAALLGSYSYAEMRIMEAQASWLPSIPMHEMKIELSYHLWDNACHVNHLRNRLPEVGGFGELTVAPSAQVECFFNEFTNTEDVLERLVGLAWVIRPHLVAQYRAQLAKDDSVTNYPTVQILETAIANHEKAIAWGNDTLQLLMTTPELTTKAEAWRAHLQALLEAAGGVTGENPSEPTSTPRNDGPGRRFITDLPQRDSRFRVQPYVRHEGRAATDVWDQESFVKYMFMMVEGEIEATEQCARTLYDFPEVPWELRYLIARQLWDEARHAELCMQRFAELGGSYDMLPVRDSFPLYLAPARNKDIARRLVHLNQLVEGWVVDDFSMMIDICRGMGDERSARLFEYLIADEWLHIKIAGDWLPKLLADDPQYRKDVIQYRHDIEQEHYQSLDIAAKETAQKRANGEIASVNTTVFAAVAGK